MDVDHSFDNILFGVDGTSVILRNNDLVSHRWQISPSPSYNHNNRNDHSSLPMVFVPMHDEEQQSTSPAVAHKIIVMIRKVGGFWISRIDGYFG